MVSFTTFNRTKFQQFNHSAAFFCAIIFMVFIPISVALINIFLFFTIIFTLLAGNLKQHFAIVWNNPVTKVALGLFALLSIGILWSIADGNDVLRVFKYNELWYMSLLLPIFYSPSRREIGINVFLISMGLILIGIYLVYFNILPSNGFYLGQKYVAFSVDGAFTSHIITNILMSFVMFVAAHKSIQTKTPTKWLYKLLFVFSLYYTLFINTGTTGQLITLSLLGLLLIQYFDKKALVLIPITAIIIGIIAYTTEENEIKNTINKIETRITHIESGNPETRPQLFIHAIKLFFEDPIIGTGTGSYKKALKIKQPIFEKLTPHKWNPHNEYINISVQLGLIGLLTLLYLFCTQANSSRKIYNLQQRYLAQGLVVLFVVGCMGNSLIMDSGEGHFWAFFSALLFSNLSYDTAKRSK